MACDNGRMRRFSTDQIGARLGQRMPGIELLRALAILLVLLQNRTSGDSSVETVFGKAWGLISGTGWTGVQLFFVISGFLITGILLDSEGHRNRIRHFFMRRVLRIFPLYFAFLGFMFLLLPALELAPQWLLETRERQFWMWTYLINWVSPYIGAGKFGHLWSLAIEEQFYLLWPWLVVLLSRRNLIRLCLLLIVSAPLIRWGLSLYDPAWENSAYTFTVARWDALALGALLACLVRDPAWLPRLQRAAFPLILILTVVVAGQLLLFHEFRAVAGRLGLINQTTAALLSAAVLFVAITFDPPRGAGWQSLATRILLTIGKYSYAIYLVHLPIKIWWIGSSPWYVAPDYPGIAQLAVLFYNFLAVLLLSTLVAAFSWRFLEQPFLRLKRYFPR